MKDKYSAVVLDIDHTLLNSERKITDYTLQSLKICADKGILPYIATARPQRLVFRTSEALSEADFLKERGAFYNGASAIDKTLDYSKNWTMPANIVNSVIEYLINKNNDIYIAIQRKDETHSFLKPFNDSDLVNWGITQSDLISFDIASNEECSKIVAWQEFGNMTDIYYKLNEKFGEDINVFITDSASWIQIMSNEASKENALIDLLALRNIPSDEVIVFGDDMPDIGMLAFFGHSVAMGNSGDSVKSVAKYVTKSNDEDGIAYALKEFFGII
ncbi:TPA: Cof-type HAD-IIB family hydrolase [bacterium]|nr:Cof-type HAD-IIB family hydrolase [bacterium]